MNAKKTIKSGSVTPSGGISYTMDEFYSIRFINRVSER